MMSDTKPRRSVQPITLPMTSMTGVGNLEIENPRLPVKSWPRYRRYCSHSGASLSPNDSLSASIWSGRS